jgi:hypothetical protein
MIKLKFDSRNDIIDLMRDKHIITSFSPREFGELIRAVRETIEEANPVVKRKQAWKREKRQLINQLKIMLAIKFIDFWRWVKSFFI